MRIRFASQALAARACGLLLLFLLAPQAPAYGCALEDKTPLVAGEDGARAAMECLINQERKKRKRRPLTVNRRLEKEAGAFAAQMVEEQFFSHEAPDGKGLIERTEASGYLRGYPVWMVGENLGWGSGVLGSPKAIMSALMASPGHRRNILNRRFRNMGVGVSTGIPLGGRFGATYVQQFGFRSR